jgi:PAS domain S-box-containing protein
MADEKHITQSHEFAENIINTVREPLICLDQDLRVVTANRSFYEIFKVKHEETVGQLIYDLGNKQWDIPRLRQLLETILPDKTIFNDYEVEHDFATIGRRVMLLNARQIIREMGRERIILLAIEDVTDHKRLENQLGASEERYRRLFETANDGILLLEKNKMKVRYANPAITSLLGYSEDECVGNEMNDIGFLHDFGTCHEVLQLLDKQGVLHYDGVRVRTKTGQIIDTDIYMVDKARLIQCNIRDITENKKAQENIRRNESTLMRLVDILQHPAETIQDFLDYALEQAILLTESKIGYIYHYHEDSKEFVLNSWSKGVLPTCTVRKPQTCYELDKTGLWGEAVRQRKPIIINNFQSDDSLKKGYPEGHVQLFKFMTIPTFKGEEIVSVIGVANKEIDYGQTDILQLSLIMDSVWKVIESKKAEEERKKMDVQLQQAQKMEAIGILAGGIAHDFNNILGAIIGYAEMIRDDFPVGSVGVHDINQVLKAGNRAKDLVKQILAFSRQIDANKIPMQLATIVNEAVKLLRASLPSTISITQDIDPAAGVILADPGQIHQIVMNFCTNAFHAMEIQGGNLTISLRKKVLTKEDLHNSPHMQPGNFIQLSFRDTGTGIAPEIRNKIFDPYFTTKERGKGTGMGLAIAHGIVQSYGGSIVCESWPQEGTLFNIILPTVEDEALQVIESTEVVPLGNERILLVDDEEILIEMGQNMLERLGYKVTARINSIEALTTFQNQPDDFDLIITDQTMLGLTGVDLARRILRIRPGIPIILCTGYSSIISEEKARSMGIKGFIMKPMAKKDIAELIRLTLDGNRSRLLPYMSPSCGS